MSTAADTSEQSRSRRPRFRFGLKTLLILIALVAIGLGLKAANDRRNALRQKRATDIASQILALNAILAANVANVPANTTVIAGRNRDWSVKDKDKRDVLGWMKDEILSTYGHWTDSRRKLTLDGSNIPKSLTAIEFAERLLRHYETGLAKHGLRRIQRGGGTAGPHAIDRFAILASAPAVPSATIYIEVRVDKESREAFVEIVLAAQVSLP